MTVTLMLTHLGRSSDLYLGAKNFCQSPKLPFMGDYYTITNCYLLYLL